jgi:ribonuclease-3
MIAYVRGEGGRDYKTILQELASADLHSLPEYRISERGPDHEKEFTATVFLGGRELGSGMGRSKKEAEQEAAHKAYVRLTEGDGAGRTLALDSHAGATTRTDAQPATARKKAR